MKLRIRQTFNGFCVEHKRGLMYDWEYATITSDGKGRIYDTLEEAEEAFQKVLNCKVIKEVKI